MSEIECKFYDGICKSPINKSDLECSLIPIERCYYKQCQMANKKIKELETVCESQIKHIEWQSEQIKKTVSKLEKIKKIAEEYKGYNRTGFEEILQIIEGEK